MRTPRFYALRKRSGWYQLFPNTTIVLFFLTMGVMLWTLDAREAEQQKSNLARDALWAEQTLQLKLEDNLAQLTDLARSVGSGETDEAGFQTQASQLLANTPEMLALARSDSHGTLRWTAPYEDGPLAPGASIQAPAAFKLAQQNGRFAYSAPFQRSNGSWRYELDIPLYQNGQFNGMLVAMFDADNVVRRLPPAWFSEKYQLELQTRDGKTIAANAASRLRGGVAEKLELPGTGLVITARPVKGAMTQARLLQLGLIAGMVLLTLLSLLSLNRHIRGRVEAERERDRVYRLSQEMLGVVRRDTTILQLNPAFEKGLGYSADELLGTSFLNYLLPEERESARDSFERLFDTGGADRFVQTSILTKQGEVRWIVWALSPLPDSGVAYVSGRDITAEKQAEQALRQESAFRKAMEDSLVVGIRAIDLQGRITYVNPSFCAITGYSEQELIGQAAPYPYWRQGVLSEGNRRDLDDTLAGEAPPEGFQSILQRKNGEVFDAHILASPLIDAHGHHTGWMAVLTDITERLEAQRRLEASHDRFVTVIEGLDAAVAVVDPASLELLFCNQRYQQWFTPDQPADSQLGYCDLRLVELMRSARDVDMEVWMDPPSRWISMRRRSIRWVNGRIVSMTILTDTTQQHDAEERYQQQMQQLQSTSRLVTMGEMASTLAHELNQPLSAIANYQAGCIERIRQGKATPEALLPVMEKITAQAERAGTVVRRIREFVKQSEPDRKTCQLPDIIEASLAIADIEARRQAATIDIRLDKDLPPLYVDPILVEQVLLNLIKNGIEAMQDCTPAERVLHVEARQLNPRRIEVAISDHGHGVPLDLKERLFDAFFTTKAEGMGMGLNICRTIIEFHEGQLWVEDKPGGGSIFRFTLPVSET
ncbi:PAS domain S-box protein [Aquitalea sp. LB_tupeE]|uniref:PAS domain S-box protein n=1 Tax=Aquitalea sp. LB_tupeE TaxID=2748078 RepID=UPI0015BD93FA|nr:PAS domain S-box protein [Aquitalea sp. LB_tupeE]NWK78968.1 PAS domain S-box protein [Aquitalea sp. LB_tupeE]